uniref:PDZ domain-containing protein n=1 Tax=Elaeophora elaphi TaxID=1147741 RepID=A0A0R3S100_9BILA
MNLDQSSSSVGQGDACHYDAQRFLEHQKVQWLDKIVMCFTRGGQLPPPPGDSDTDSGICADSDNQLSPRHPNAVFLDDKSKKLQRKFEIPAYREHLTPESAWRVRKNISYQRCLPEGQKTNSYNSQIPRNGKQHRVRFADQVSSTDGSLSSSSGWDNTDLAGVNNCVNNSSDCYLHRSTMGIATATSTMPNPDHVCPKVISDSNNGIINKLSGRQHADNIGYSNHRQPKRQHQISGSYEQDGTASGPLPQSPPGYSVAMTRLRRSDDQHLTHSNEPSCRIIRRFHSRSASLPRGMHRQSEALEIRCGSIDCCYPPQNYSSYTPENEVSINACLMRSVDNLSITERGHSSFTNGARLSSGRRLPELPIDYAAYDGAIQQATFGRQRRGRKAGANYRSQSVGRASRSFNSKMANCYTNSDYIPLLHRSHLPSVRAQLIALDHRGLRIVLIEKLQPGPFGFYIATGILNQKRGIFISRVSLPSLAPVLSVGDEIIYVEDELVKGEDLEYVQALIAGKSSVKIVLLPTVGPNAC